MKDVFNPGQAYVTFRCAKNINRLNVLDVDETKIKMSYSVQNEMDRRQKNVAVQSPFVHIQDNSSNQLKIALLNP